ncbi:hypothetical protein [Kineothrix sedimenti]|uniref:Intein n=1 Tax=Kineothrix sedimenti TaxID=3123317 RepID=A0ABZ3EUF0_9FIRM
MAIFYTKTITLYNRTVTGGVMGGETWFPTVFTDVRLLINKGANIAATSMNDADSAKLHISRRNLPKPYLPPIEWQALTDTGKGENFTLTSGHDFFVEGDTSAETVKSEDFFSYMKGKYSNCYKITNADIYDLIPHFEIGGR